MTKRQVAVYDAAMAFTNHIVTTTYRVRINGTGDPDISTLGFLLMRDLHVACEEQRNEIVRSN